MFFHFIKPFCRVKSYASKLLDFTKSNRISKYPYVRFNERLFNAFSLAEMLIALLIASVLLAALAPVITRKMKDSINVNATDAGTSAKYRVFQFDDCKDNKDGTSECTFVVPEKVYMIDLYLQGAGGGGAGATGGVNEECSFDTYKGNTSANKTVCKTSSLSVSAASTSKLNPSAGYNTLNVYIVPGMQNLSAVLIGAGGAGGGAVGKTDCYENNIYKYLTPSQNGGAAACVTKYNVGDTYLGGPSANISGNTVVNAGQSCSGSCCWQGNNVGQTAASLYCTNTYGNPSDSNYVSYGGCKRTACTWPAANNACSNYTGGGLSKGQWRLPNLNEMSAWVNNVKNINYDKGIEGLMICNDIAEKNGNVNCENTSACVGSYDSGCHSYDIWTSNQAGTKYNNGWFMGTSAGIQGHPQNAAFGVRCLSTNASLYGWKSYNGGGGSSGTVAEIYSSSAFMNKYLAENKNKILHFYMHGPYKGAPAGAANADNSQNGDECNTNSIGIHLHSEDNASYLASVIDVFGGKGGYGGSVNYKSSYAQGGDVNSATCNTSLAINKGSDYSCTPGIKGSPASVSSGGTGGSIVYKIDNTTYSCSGGAGSTIQGAQDGSKPSCYGAGGGGAASVEAGNGKGGEGGSPYSRGKYNVIRQGASGGGGGGGARLVRKAVNVVPQSKITVIIGKGGKGGTGGSVDGSINGLKGGDTKVIIGDITYIAHGGSGGLKGTDDDVIPLGGTGGAGASGSPANSTITSGEKGKNGDYDEDNKISIGGKGGMSGSKASGLCGGLMNTAKDNSCAVVSVNAQSFTFLAETVIKSLVDTFIAPLGQGGGGGGFKGAGSSGLFGNGSDGVNGYVFLDWRKY